MSLLKILLWSIWGVCVVWLALSNYQTASYEFGVNDCSNMVYRSELLLDRLNIDSSIHEKSNGDGTSHVWIVIDCLGFQIPYEATKLTPIIDRRNYIPDRVFNSTSEIIRLHPSLANEYVK